MKNSRVKKANAVGRPLLSGAVLEINPEILNKITTILRIGSYIEVAAAVNGIGYSTLRTWVTKARENPDSLYGEFARAVEKAVSEAEIRDLATIDMHSQGREAIFEYEVAQEAVLDSEGNAIKDKEGYYLKRIVYDSNGKPYMRLARNKDGDPIIKRSEIKPQWTAAAWKLERRNPTKWGRAEYLDAIHKVLTAEDPKVIEEKEKINEEKVKGILGKFRDEY